MKRAEPVSEELRKVFSKPAEPKATSATVPSMQEFVEWLGGLDSSDPLPGIGGKDKPMPFIHGAAQMRNHIQLEGARRIYRARAEAKEAPEPERRDSLLILKREFAKRAEATRDHLAWEIAETMVDAELSKQPAKEAPAGEVDYSRDGRILMAVQNGINFDDDVMPEELEDRLRRLDAEQDRAHDELSRAGIPDGALDERVRTIIELRDELQASYDALPAHDGKRVRYVDVNHLVKRSGQALRERDAARQEAAGLDKALDGTMALRDAHHDAVQDTHVALGGDGEWTNLHDLNKETPELAAQRMKELAAARQEALDAVLARRRVQETADAAIALAAKREGELADAGAEVEKAGIEPQGRTLAARIAKMAALHLEDYNALRASQADVERLRKDWTPECEKQRDDAIARAEKAEKELDERSELKRDRDYWRDIVNETRKALKLVKSD